MARRVPWIVGELIIQERITGALRLIENLTGTVMWRLGDRLRLHAKMLAPMLTGALKASISVTTRQRSDHNICVTRAKSLRPEAFFAGKTRPPRHAVDIHASAHYATFQEFGSTKNKAHPFLIPAMMGIASELSIIFAPEWHKFLSGLPVKTQRMK